MFSEIKRFLAGLRPSAPTHLLLGDGKFFLALLILLAACAVPPSAAPTPTAAVALTATSLPSPTPTFTPSPSPLPSLTPTLAPTSTPVWQTQGPGKVTCVILLYHRIETPPFPNEYYVTPEDFRAQMQALKDWNYTPIPISLLVQAINQGAPLPPRPIVISFDDGDISVYNAAFPIMQEFGFVGINYIVSNRLSTAGYMNPEQLAELAAAGWEVGSHSINHANLLEDPNPRLQLEKSRHDLEAALNVPVKTFAWPFGNSSPALRSLAAETYRAAVGLGPQFDQTTASLFYLRRRPVLYGWDVATFARFLPWSDVP